MSITLLITLKDRRLKRQTHLDILKSAINAMDIQDRSYVHADGRIREIEDEINYLDGLLSE